MAATAGGDPAAEQDGRLRGWKDISRWFGVNERTVRRWEASRGLPVHHVPGQGRATVFAFEPELRAWLVQGRAGPAEPPVPIHQHRPAPARGVPGTNAAHPGLRSVPTRRRAGLRA